MAVEAIGARELGIVGERREIGAGMFARGGWTTLGSPCRGTIVRGGRGRPGARLARAPGAGGGLGLGGVLKTIDGGQTWFKSLDWSYNSQRGVWAVKINPLNPNTVFANTTEGVFRSHDAGVTWQQVHNVVMGTDVEINPIDTSIILSAHGNFGSTGYGIYRSSDAGNTWTQITSGLPVTYNGKILLDIYKANPNIVYASIGHGFLTGYGASWLCKSTDSGLTWTIFNQTDYS